MLLLSCSSGQVDPDLLPSVEILLVPPKHPFPQLSEEVQRLRSLREKSELKLGTVVRKAFERARDGIAKEIPALIEPFISRIQQSAAFLEVEDSRTVENVVVNIAPVHDVGIGLKEEVGAIFEKQGRDEDSQIQQSAKEFEDVKKVLVGAVSSSLKKYFSSGKTRKSKTAQRGNNPAFLQLVNDQSTYAGMKPVLNLRVGSSAISDGLKDGSSYPSVFGIIQDEFQSRTAAENALMNSILSFTRSLGEDCIRIIGRTMEGVRGTIHSSFIDPSAPIANMVKQSLKYLPPGVPRLWRKRAFQHSTIEVDIHPPTSDEEIDREQLRAMLKSDELLRNGRLKAYTAARKRLLNDLVIMIDEEIRNHAIRLGFWSDGDYLPKYTLNELLFDNKTNSL